MDISGKVVIVTGGASGLGLATTEKLLEDGATVLMLDLPSSLGDEVADRLGERVAFADADVRDEAGVQAAVDAASELGELRGLVNCAGTGNAIRTVGRKGPFPLDRFAMIVEINLIGSFNVLRLAAARMAELEPLGEERGVVINTASAAAFDGQVGQAAYSASKGGIVGMTLPIARDLASLGIRVVTIAPGLFDTPLMAQMPEEQKLELGRQAPHPGRLGQPEEFGALASHVFANPFLNGETIRLDGAIRLPPR
ncbi:MAG: 3-hydroxyacyl-CoA dehydrogenase [Solirubrobacterales bacterium]